ncbi:MAG: hypothetical protein ACMUEM_04790 [Flavobacteriales bacterium AspAUS03]
MDLYLDKPFESLSVVLGLTEKTQWNKLWLYFFCHDEEVHFILEEQILIMQGTNHIEV